MESQMKYLGLIIDSQWPFGPCFELLASKVAAAANVLCGMLPKIGGVGVQCANCTRRYPISCPVWSPPLHLFVREIFTFAIPNIQHDDCKFISSKLIKL